CCESVILRCIVLVLRTPPRPTPFPYTTLFRSAWAHRSWWGPGWQSALPLSNNSPPLDGIGFQRAAGVPSESPWLSWLGPWNTDRSEEHTSELQSRSDLVCRLLLEKKKQHIDWH